MKRMPMIETPEIRRSVRTITRCCSGVSLDAMLRRYSQGPIEEPVLMPCDHFTASNMRIAYGFKERCTPSGSFSKFLFVQVDNVGQCQTWVDGRPLSIIKR